jgi:hypothetical protein
MGPRAPAVPSMLSWTRLWRWRRQSHATSRRRLDLGAGLHLLQLRPQQLLTIVEGIGKKQIFQAKLSARTLEEVCRFLSPAQPPWRPSNGAPSCTARSLPPCSSSSRRCSGVSAAKKAPCNNRLLRPQPLREQARRAAHTWRQAVLVVIKVSLK